MGGAILTGLLASDVTLEGPVSVTTRSARSAAAFEADARITAHALETDPDANRNAARGAGLVVLGVKPWQIVEVVREIADVLEPGATLVSVAAGVPTAAIEAVAPEGVGVVRAMPNTPARIGSGMTGIAPGATGNETHVDRVRILFETVGRVLAVEEARIDEVTAVSGSGPAYVFLYAEAMTAAAVARGFTEQDAALLVSQTLLGAAELVASGDASPTELRRRVTSPNGTTERAVEVLQTADWTELFERALAANVQRSEELAAERD